jgi:hypothetical protein
MAPTIEVNYENIIAQNMQILERQPDTVDLTT